MESTGYVSLFRFRNAYVALNGARYLNIVQNSTSCLKMTLTPAHFPNNRSATGEAAYLQIYTDKNK